MVRKTLLLCLPLLAMTGCDSESLPAADSAEPAQAADASTEAATPPEPPPPLSLSLAPLPGREDDVPDLTHGAHVRLQTTAGEVLIEVYPEAAPNAAQRFLFLVTSGYYDDTPISRVVPGFVAQFGINWRDQHRGWQDRHFDDDPTLFALDRGTLAFAKAGANTNSTQVFINYSENNRLADPSYNFTVFGKVVRGMEIVDSFVQVGDASGGLDQGLLWNDGGNYLASLPVKPTMIESAELLD